MKRIFFLLSLLNFKSKFLIRIIFGFLVIIAPFHQGCSKFQVQTTLHNPVFNSDPTQNPAVNLDPIQNEDAVAIEGFSCSLFSNSTVLQLNETAQLSALINGPTDLQSISAKLLGTNRLVSDNTARDILPTTVLNLPSIHLKYETPTQSGELIRRVVFSDNEGKTLCTTNNVNITFSSVRTVENTPPVSSNGFTSMINGWKKDGSSLRGLQNNQFGFSFNDIYTNYKTIKVYVPAGTTEFGIVGFLPQQTPYAVVARFGQPPLRTSPINGTIGADEYGDINRVFSQAKAFAQLLAGEEMIQVHDGGGSTGYTGVARLRTRPLLKGKWLYMRVLNDPNGGGIYNFQGGGDVDLTMYKERMTNVQLNAEDNPIEDMILPERPTGITLQPSTVAPGGNSTISPDNTKAMALGNCVLDSANTLSQFVRIQNYKITVESNAPAGVIKVSCGDATDFSSDSAFSIPVFHANLTIAR